MTTYLIEPVDTWFFREARPFDVAGGNELSSLFPPPARTVASALHTVLNGAEASVPLNKARCRGPYLVRRTNGMWERLYPAPLDLFKKSESPREADPPDAPPAYLRLIVPNEPVRCDLGNVLLPALAKGERGAKPLENAWLTAAQLGSILSGGLPDGTVVSTDDLFVEESRIGLARNNRHRIAAKGMLFSTRHVRLREDVALAAEWLGTAKPNGRQNRCVRFGGEGRLAHVSEIGDLAGLKPPKAQGGERGLILLLLTPVQFRPVTLPVSPETRPQCEPTTVPPGLEKTELNGRTVWKGRLVYRKDGVEGCIRLAVECAVIGKAAREGGWNLRKDRPRPVRNYLPAGSLWYCTLPDGQDKDALNQAIAALHGAQIGEDTHFGRGELAVGLWR
jgi:CRISPR-associated protein Cmr3